MYYIIPCSVHVHSSFYNLCGERMENVHRGVSSRHNSFSHISNFWGSSFRDFHRHYVWHPSVSNLLRWNRYWESQTWWFSSKEGLLAEPEGHFWPPLQLEVVFTIQYTKVCILQIIPALCVISGRPPRVVDCVDQCVILYTRWCIIIILFLYGFNTWILL